MTPELSQSREEINQIDAQLTQLFLRRMQVAADVAAYKKENGLPVLDSAREHAVVNRLCQGKNEQDAADLTLLYERIFQLSRARQTSLLDEAFPLGREITLAAQNSPKKLPAGAAVACQGVAGAYSQIACERLFSRPDIVFMQSFEGVIKAVQSGLCAYGVLPVENNIHGSVGAVYDLLLQYPVYIVKALRLPVRHVLAAKPGAALAQITRVLSHEQALGQCGRYLKAHPGMKTAVCENTAVAAKIVAEGNDSSAAAICSPECCELYGLQALLTDLQDSDNNHTRFLCISRELQLLDNVSKLSVQFCTRHRPGALSEVLSRVAAAGINLAKLECRPIAGQDFEFSFYADLECDCREPAVQRLLQDLSGCTAQLRFLGGYTES